MKKGLLLIALLVLLVPPVLGQEATLVDSCVTEYDTDTDYFPDKADIEYAEGFTIAYFNHYKVVTVIAPWADAASEDAFQYVLIQCGTPPPIAATFPEGTQFIEVPVDSIIAMSTTYLPHLADMDLVDSLIGLDNFLLTNTPEVIEKIEAGELIEVGYGAGVNVEAVLEAEPGIVMTYGALDPTFSAHPVLLEAGVPVALNGDFIEADVLARAEWGKFIAAFFNAEAEANAIFDEIVIDYESVKKITAEIPEEERVTILWNAFQSFSDSWPIPNEDSWVAGLLQDAGLNFVLEGLDAPGVNSPASYETVYEAGLDAPIWIANTFGIFTVDDLLALDERNADFAAVQNNQVYNTNKRVNENGGDDFYETGAAYPNLLLRDLVAVVYPDLLPDYEPMFIRKLETAE